MSKSKRKGSRYELDLVELFQDESLAAYKVPLSGALGGQFSADVVLCEEWRIEVKYRRNGEGFSQLYKWIEGYDVLELPCCWVYTFSAFIGRTCAALDGYTVDTMATTTKTVTRRETLHAWLGDADVLALRKAGHSHKRKTDCWLFMVPKRG